VEEKYQKEKAKPVKGQYGDKYDDDEDSSSDEDEDDEGFLATEDLDAEISATLQAIRNKDPRVYDEKVTFYAPIEETLPKDDKQKAEKPMYLRDYHRENLLKQANGEDADMEDAPPMTFAEEQEKLKQTVVKEMHAAVSDEDEDEDGGFLIPKSKPEKPAKKAATIHPSRRQKIDLDITVADKDPETFLSNFMAARAWLPGEGTAWQPLESDDEEEDERADKFETAFNLRFEDPKASNEVLKSYARDIIAEKSVRREEPKSRKKARDAEREKREAEKRQREEEKARLRKLKIDQMEEKLAKIKKAAGLSGKTLKDKEWTTFLDDGWDDEAWEAEMNKKFGEDYYAEPEAGSDEDSDAEKEGKSKKKKVKKPKWDDDIDINDIIPDFVDEEETEKPVFTLSDDEAEEISENDDEEGSSKKKSKSSKDRKSEAQAKKKAARLERKKIEELVDAKLDVDHAILPTKSKAPSRFRYRETSPTSFGLTARDILMAPDTSLNQFVGLKKMATFRDAEKKRKDKKRLGKKARLREWRKETFGNEDGPEIIIGEKAADIKIDNDDVDIIEGKKKKKRSRKSKAATEEI
jgi:protein KRI1